MNQRVSKKNSVEDDFFDIEGVESGTASADAVDGNEAKSTSSTATSTTNSRTVSSSNSANSARSGSLSEEVVTSSTRRRPTGQTSVTSRGSRDNLLSGGGGSKDSGVNTSQQSQPMSQSMPATILNLEENRVTIQVPGVQSSNVQQRTSQHPTVVKQSSAEKGKIYSTRTYVFVRWLFFEAKLP